jgi:hypothetical protein
VKFLVSGDNFLQCFLFIPFLKMKSAEKFDGADARVILFLWDASEYDPDAGKQ